MKNLLFAILLLTPFANFAQGGDGSAQSMMTPIPKFYFAVNFGTDSGMEEVIFQEVSGLDIESQIIEYRASNAPRFNTAKMPGIVKNENVTLKNGLFKDDNAFWEWYGMIKMNTIARTDLTIRLLDENGEAQMTWVLKNAWPSKISTTDLSQDENEVAVETIELVHEGITVEGKAGLEPGGIAPGGLGEEETDD